MNQYRPFSRATWSIYLFLLAIRVFIAISPGYIHPDEFFQSAEITAGNEKELHWDEEKQSKRRRSPDHWFLTDLIFNVPRYIGSVFDLNVNIPWEYKPELPCRSILIPYDPRIPWIVETRQKKLYILAIGNWPLTRSTVHEFNRAITTGLPYLVLRSWIGNEPGMGEKIKSMSCEYAPENIDHLTFVSIVCSTQRLDQFVTSRALFLTQRIAFVLLSLVIGT